MGAGPQLTKEEEQTLERLKQVCSKHGKKSNRTLTDCALLKQREIDEYNRLQTEIKNIAVQKLNTVRMEAFMYVTARMSSILTEGQLLSNALQKASGEYDAILTSQAKQPIAKEIILGLVFTVLPELKIVGRVMSALGSARIKVIQGKVVDLNDKNWEEVAGNLLSKQAKINSSNSVMITFGQSLDSMSKDAIDSIRNPIKASADVDAETQKRLAAFAPKNQILSSLIKAIETRLILAGKLQIILYQFILWYQGDDLVVFVKSLFRILGFDNDIAYDAKSFDLFADFILYDMLKAYASQYCAVYVNMVAAGASFNDMVSQWHEVDGLDQSQRGMIYNKFGSKVWTARTGYPSVNNSRELVTIWKVKMISDLNDKEIPMPSGNTDNKYR